MIKRTFTIVELLVAMALTFVVIMALSTIYVRISNFALEQAGSASSYSAGSTVLDKINDDMRHIYLPGTKPGTGGSPGRLISTLATRTTGTANTISFQPSGSGWPYFGFTATPSGNYTNAPAKQAIVYFCGPSLLDSSPSIGKISNNLLTLYRLTASNPSSTYFDSTTTLTANSDKMISNKVIYMAMVAYLGYNPTGSRKARTVFDTNSDSFSNSYNYTPEDVDVILTVVPDSGYLEFKITSSPSGSSTFNSYHQSELAGETVGDTAITKVSTFSWDPEGFFANLTNGYIFYYRTNPTGGIIIWSASAPSSISASDTLITGTTTKRRVTLK